MAELWTYEGYDVIDSPIWRLAATAAATAANRKFSPRLFSMCVRDIVYQKLPPLHVYNGSFERGVIMTPPQSSQTSNNPVLVGLKEERHGTDAIL